MPGIPVYEGWRQKNQEFKATLSSSAGDVRRSMVRYSGGQLTTILACFGGCLGGSGGSCSCRGTCSYLEKERIR